MKDQKLPTKRRFVYSVRDPHKCKSFNFNDRYKAWEYARHVGADGVMLFEIDGKKITHRKDQKPVFS